MGRAGASSAGRRFNVVADWEVLDVVGDGALGTVYSARHRYTRRRAALKVLSATSSRDAEAVRRLFHSALAVATLRHPAIVDVFECDTLDDGTAYLAMELLTGERLSALVSREGRLAVSVACAIARQLAGALAAAHDLGVAHGGLTLDSVYLVPPPPRSSVPGVKLLGFGIAGFGAQSDAIVPVAACAAADAESDGRADMCALGSVLFDMLTGRSPRELNGEDRSVAAALHPTARDGLQGPWIPGRLAELVTGLMEGRGAPSNMAAVVSALQQLMDELPADEGTDGEWAPNETAQPRRETLLPTDGHKDDVAAVAGALSRWLRGRRWILAAPAVLGGLALAWWALSSVPGSDASEGSPPPARVREAVTSAPSPESPARTAPSAELAGARKVRLRLHTQPPGAQVTLRGADRPLGVTPLSVEMDAAPGTRELTFKLRGFRPRTKLVPAETDTLVDVELTRFSRPGVRPAVAGAAAAAPVAPESFELIGD